MVLGLLILLNNSLIVKAHDVSINPWLIINNESLSTDNESPNTSKLEWSEHVLTKNFEKKREINFKVDLEALGFEKNVEVKWQIEDKNLNGVEVNHLFEETGNYFVKIEVIEENKSEFDETFMIIIGDEIEPTSFSVDGQEVSDVNPTKDISRFKEIEFKVINPDIQKYDYIWDLNDGQTMKATSAIKSFENTKLPGYVILRTIDKRSNVFADSYVKLRSDDPQSFEVNTPSRVATTNEGNSDNNKVFTILGVISGGLIIVGLGSFLLFQNKLKKHKS